jgi:Fe2+ transport system protein FeoA
MNTKLITNNQNSHQSLANLQTGITAKVVSVLENGTISRRLQEMGIIPGSTVRVVKTAPFGCPMEIRVRGFNLAIRRTEAETILINCE